MTVGIEPVNGKLYQKRLNASLNAPRLIALVRDGVVVQEWTHAPGYSDDGAPWGTIGLSEDELRARGFRRMYVPKPNEI